MIEELYVGAQAGNDEIGFDTVLSQVNASWHFLDAPQTMARNNTAFYETIIHDYANFGTWTERGAQDANLQARKIWQDILVTDARPSVDPACLARLQSFIAKRTAEGGAPPES